MVIQRASCSPIACSNHEERAERIRRMAREAGDPHGYAFAERLKRFELG